MPTSKKQTVFLKLTLSLTLSLGGIAPLQHAWEITWQRSSLQTQQTLHIVRSDSPRGLVEDSQHRAGVRGGILP